LIQRRETGDELKSMQKKGVLGRGTGFRTKGRNLPHTKREKKKRAVQAQHSKETSFLEEKRKKRLLGAYTVWKTKRGHNGREVKPVLKKQNTTRKLQEDRN